jgi:hypothetical protein
VTHSPRRDERLAQYAPAPLEHSWLDRQGQVERNFGIPPILNPDYRKEHTPMRVACYRNLRRRDWSIAEVRGINGVGRVISHERSKPSAPTRHFMSRLPEVGPVGVSHDQNGLETTMTSSSEWTSTTIATLRQLWSEGHSTTEIGRRMGFSKNAIVGKAPA